MENPNHNIKSILRKLDYQFNQDYSSVYFVSDLDSSNKLLPKIAIDLDKAKTFNVTAVYFRFFDGDRMPQPQIYIYDNLSGLYEEKYYAEMHRNIWSASEITIFMVIGKTSINIYDCRQPVTVDRSTGEISNRPIDTIDLNSLSDADEAARLFKSQLFNSGSFWESEELSKHFLYNNTAYQKLVNGLKSVREYFKEKSNISSELTDHILILAILVRYLEENGIDDNGKNLAQQFFLDKTGCNSLIEAIEKNKINELFEALAEHFNGGIFTLTTQQKKELAEANLDALNSFLEGKLDDKLQTIIWSEYSFKNIPIELISNFYEEFLPKEKKKSTDKKAKKKDTGSVYTPSYLVNFLVDESLPLDNSNLDYNVKLIDVSCGSGIFLVTAFKRLVQRWRIANKRADALANTNPEILKKILKDNIFGIDIDAKATELSIFSLNLSICSMLTPKQIWTDLKFDNLQKDNIIRKDFFDFIVDNKNDNFDLVIGNPPFVSVSKSKYDNYVKKLNEYDKGFIYDIPDHQYSLMFLDKAMTLLKEKGLLCLIMPSGPLLYNGTINFRKCFFEKYNVPQIIDFTYLRNVLFKTANVASAALFVQKTAPDDKDILHITVKRTKSSKEKNYFEIDHYDFHYVPKSIASSSRNIWKINLVGGARIYNLIEKIKLFSKDSTIKSYIISKGLNVGQGYKLGKKDKYDKENYIYNNSYVIDKYFKDDGIKKIGIERESKFETIPASNDIFSPPHILIKKTIGEKSIPIEYRDDYLAFRNEILGIHSTLENKDDLLNLVSIFKKNNDVFRFFIASTSGRSGISRSIYTSLAEDFYKLPVIENIKLKLSDEILIHDVNKYIIPSFEKGENALINKVCSQEEIKQFSDVYCCSINTIYKEKSFKYTLEKIYEGAAYFACEYKFTDLENKIMYIKSEQTFSELIDNWSSRNALIKRVLRIYGNNVIILIKPKQLRYWLKSIALRDADETLAESFDVEY